MLLGWMPPHPGCFIERQLFKNKLYSTQYKIASDFEFLFNLSLKLEIKWFRYEKISVVMDNRGISSQLKNKILINKELRDILKSYGKIFFSRIIKIIITTVDQILRKSYFPNQDNWSKKIRNII